MKNIGKVIKKLREKQGISVASIAEGICSAKYIYKVESGEATPSLLILIDIFSKLRTDMYSIVPFLDYDNPLFYVDVKGKLDKAREKGDFTLLESELSKIDNNLEIKTGFRQYLEYNKAVVHLFKYKDFDSMFLTIVSALALTDIELTDEKIEISTLSLDEIRLVIMYGIYLNEIKKFENSEKLLRNINEFLVPLVENIHYQKLFGLSMINLSICYIAQEKYSKSIDLLIEFKNIIISGKWDPRVHVIYYLLSLSYYHLQEYKISKKYVEISKQIADDYKDIKTFDYCNELIAKLEYDTEELEVFEDMVYGINGDIILKIKSLSNDVILIQWLKHENGSLNSVATVLESIADKLNRGKDKVFLITDFRAFHSYDDFEFMELSCFYERLENFFGKYLHFERFRVINNEIEEMQPFYKMLDKFEVGNFKSHTKAKVVTSIKQAIDQIKLRDID